VAALIRATKAERGCRDCGEVDPDVLDFHHLRDKLFSLSDVKNRNMPQVRAEIAKCVVLCANCHRRVHAKERVAAESDRPAA
jgi:predicted HNH restriction endonuclease